MPTYHYQVKDSGLVICEFEAQTELPDTMYQICPKPEQGQAVAPEGGNDPAEAT